MRCNICGKFMRYESSYDFIDYYRCIEDCDGLVADFNSEEKNMDKADKENKNVLYKM
jgi:hypothetical protein